MIEKLDTVLEHCSDGVLKEYPPHPFVLMEKINELVDAFNQLEKKIEKLQVL